MQKRIKDRIAHVFQPSESELEKKREFLEEKDDSALLLVVAMHIDTSVIAEEILMQRYKPLVKSLARNYFLDGSDREDVVQEGMIGLMRAIRDYDPEAGAAFPTFARLCIDRQLVTALRHSKRVKNAVLNESLSLDEQSSSDEEHSAPLEQVMTDADEDPAIQVLLRDLEDRLEHLDGEFSPLEQEVWEQMRLGGTSRDIAERLGRPVKVVDNTVQRVRRKVLSLIDHH